MKRRKGIRLLVLLLSLSIGLGATACDPSDAPVSELDMSETVTTTEPVGITFATESTAGSTKSVTTTVTTGGVSMGATTTTIKPTAPPRITTTVMTTTTTTEIKVAYPSEDKTSEIGFGMYGVGPDGGWTTTFDDFIQTDWYNTTIASPADLIEGLQKGKEHNTQIFVNVGGSLWRYYGRTAKLIERWQEELDKIIRTAKDSGCYEALAGFYMDEPLLCGVTHEELLKATKYMREATNFEKRVFVCFAVPGVAPDSWNYDCPSPPIVPETGKYITDAAYDIYGVWDDSKRQTMETLTKEMKARLGNRDDVRIWYIPPVMNHGGTHTEQNSIDFLNGVLELLKREENPGGIMGYSYAVGLGETESMGNIGLGELLRPDREERWPRLFERIQEIGRDICTGKTFGR